MKIPSLFELASDAMDSLSNLCESDEDFDAINDLSDLEKVKLRYNHADCDDFAFAMHVITGWDIVGVTSPKNGPLHRLVVIPEDGEGGAFKGGAYVDVSGYVDPDILGKRYKAKNLEFIRSAAVLGPAILDDDELRRVISTMTHLPGAPFDNPAFMAKVNSWIEFGFHFDEPEPELQPEPVIEPSAPARRMRM